MRTQEEEGGHADQQLYSSNSLRPGGSTERKLAPGNILSSNSNWRECEAIETCSVGKTRRDREDHEEEVGGRLSSVAAPVKGDEAAESHKKEVKHAVPDTNMEGWGSGKNFHLREEEGQMSDDDVSGPGK